MLNLYIIYLMWASCSWEAIFMITFYDLYFVIQNIYITDNDSFDSPLLMEREMANSTYK